VATRAEMAAAIDAIWSLASAAAPPRFLS